MTTMSLTPPPTQKVHRVEVRPAADQPDPTAASITDLARQTFGPTVTVRSSRIYLIEAAIDESTVQRLAHELLADSVSQEFVVCGSELSDVVARDCAMIEIHYKPGVMDPVAASTREAIADLIPEMSLDHVQVRTGWRYDLGNLDVPPETVRRFAERTLANPVIEDIYRLPHWPTAFASSRSYSFRLIHVPIRELDDHQLSKLSREQHLFLGLDELHAVQTYFSERSREPTDIELETIAQTWSEHCVHKTLKSTIRYRGAGFGDKDDEIRPGHTRNDDGSITITNLMRSTIFAATQQLMASKDLDQWCVSVFADNAGIVRFDDHDGVCIKVETHNHPSAIEPYGGAATGIGGCIRDILGTGLAARPIANTDVFCVANPSINELPKGVIPPKRILEGVVAGVRDYGNRMGIPTVNGAVYFDNSYLGNPLVFAGCVGTIPLDRCFGKAEAGDHIIVLGGATGRDGFHGATFSSAELTDTHADEFAHVVQIGNPITEKKMTDAILAARDHEHGPLFHDITDCGAGGFSSAVGEMGRNVGAQVTLESAPLKYEGLSYTEIWISEAQERMVLAVPNDKLDSLRELCTAEDVSMCHLGQFGHTDDQGQPELLLTYDGHDVGRLSMNFLNHGLPTPTRIAVWEAPTHALTQRTRYDLTDMPELLYQLLAHPNIASKHWIIRQYDHEVQGNSVIKPLVGPNQDGPSDAAVIRPKMNSHRGIAVGCGLAPALANEARSSDADPYWMAYSAIDEAVRNVVCVGADAGRIALLDNFCWPSCDNPKQLGTLVRAAEACYDGAIAYRSPFVSGKDSLNNQFTTEKGEVVTIVPTLLITALGIVNNVACALSMDAKAPGNTLLVVGLTTDALGGSHLHLLANNVSGNIPKVDPVSGPMIAAAVSNLIQKRKIASAHDCSDGGVLCAAAEMAFSGMVGLDLDLSGLPTHGQLSPSTAAFAETPSRYLLEVEPAHLDTVIRQLRGQTLPFGQVGAFASHKRFTVRTPQHGCVLDEPLEKLRNAWRKPLDW